MGCLLFLPVNRTIIDRVRGFGISSVPISKGMEGLFVEQRLSRWESAMRSMADALPDIAQADSTLVSGKELGEVLCADCPERELCWARNQQHTEMLLDEMMRAALLGEKATAEQFPLLRDCECQRLAQVPQAAAEARQLHHDKLAERVKARFEREMTMTHLEAMANILQEIRGLTCGETFSDLQAAYQINKALRDLHFPGQLCYARRVDGHLQAALETDLLTPIGKQPDKFLRYLADDAGLSLSVTRSGKNRIELEELPLYHVELGVASLCAGQQTVWEDGDVSGDAIAAKQCQGGRFLLMLSDGMGHGKSARVASKKTLELLLLCMEAGYSRRQAITAVNGMMLSAMEEDRFATVDLFDLSLWTGDVRNEKLGACSSWVVRGNYLKEIEGSSLPLGILEDARPTSQSLRMHSGDILVLVSDGVADVLSQREEMERAILDNLYIQPQRMADALLRSALLAGGGTPKDDMTVLTLLMVDRQRSDAVPGVVHPGEV
jgi:stage II sporulation protein E